VKARIAALCGAVALPLAACPLPGTPLQAGAVGLAWQLLAGPIEVGRHFALEVQLCPAEATLRRVDAAMPEHRHGMNYRPSLQALGGGRWRVEGLMFHMPGRWELRFDVDAAGQAETLRQSIVLP
jgi:hypothetical protein